jgi:hypothetical protein
MSSISSINPIDILTLCEKMQWPCPYDEAVTVLLAIDDVYREINQPKQST